MGARGQRLGGQHDRRPLRVFMCVLMVVSACRKVRKRKEFHMSSHGNNQKHNIIFHSSQFNPVFLFWFLINFLFLRLLLILCHCYSMQSLHMHIL